MSTFDFVSSMSAKKSAFQKKTGELIVTLGLLLWGVFLYWQSFFIPITAAAQKSNIITSTFFPRLISFSIIGLSSAHIFLTVLKIMRAGEQDIFDRSASEQNSSEQAGKKGLVSSPLFRVAVAGILTIGFVLLFYIVGFLPSSFVFMLCFLTIFHKKHLVINIALSAAFTVTVFLIFRYVFIVLLPEGILFQ
ncbi:MAG: tripartite tricarboxylate transporter TctB family protein [bacterium]|nr:tripartite tricarboxylate transporter TctB family protein [bacterium]